MPPDFPAAHSMDTSWYAVDKCGHVAVFRSGEEGAVPSGHDEDAPNPLRSREPMPGELDQCFRDGVIAPGKHDTKLSTHEGTTYACGFYLLGPGLRGDRTHIHASSSSEELHFGTTDGRDWLEGTLSADTWTWLHAAPHRCLGCVLYLRVDFDRRAEALRIFRFECDGYGTPPYERGNLPYNPATLEEVRAQFPLPISDPPRFSEFCFRDKPRLQPIQWIKAWGWSPEWTDEEGRSRNSDGTVAEGGADGA